MSPKQTGAVPVPHERLEQASWRDPEDAVAMERDPVTGRAHRRTISGWRAIDPLKRLPCEPEHHKAANMLRHDWECGSGALGGSIDLGRTRTSGGNRDYFSETQLRSRMAYEDAVQKVGIRACAVMLPVVLGGLTIRLLAERTSANPVATQARVMAALDRLVEHYGIGRKEVVVNVWEPVTIVDAGSTLPQDRLGRVKK